MMDRRIRRTRRALKEALLGLILEEGFTAVTVEEITDRADVGRTTFYLHYRDKEELLLESISELAEGLVEEISQVPMVDPVSGQPAVSRAVEVTFRHASENPDLYRVILQSGFRHGAGRLREIMNAAVHQIIEGVARNEQRSLKPQVPMPVLSNYLVGSWIGVMTWWLEDDMPYSPAEMAGMFEKVIMLGGAKLMGGEQALP
jgi:AcrR family transcriptional regulator